MASKLSPVISRLSMLMGVDDDNLDRVCQDLEDIEPGYVENIRLILLFDGGEKRPDDEDVVTVTLVTMPRDFRREVISIRYSDGQVAQVMYFQIDQVLRK